MTETAVPLTSIGAVTGATTWVPEATPSAPFVSAAGAGAGCAGAGAGSTGALPPSVDDVLSPTTATEVPSTVTGTETLMSACDPEPTPSEPLVPPLGAGADSGVLEPDVELSASPRTAMEVPLTVIGASTETMPWVPESSPSSPVVSAAWATEAPRIVIPPATSVPQMARETMVFMSVLSLRMTNRWRRAPVVVPLERGRPFVSQERRRWGRRARSVPSSS
ncbi:hypothetical protein QE367_002069 [Microbacterium paludicola]|uniref:Uncharacterized protein n=1 Tax=Microbacterium paludicola TaxID=300019 RepID=A0ABU1I2E2_9MICO|nr:hypothetical protein [Microbacterium paludicola]MDR6167865.1 hypothetical protein [Microbacterium paludicola]